MHVITATVEIASSTQKRSDWLHTGTKAKQKRGSYSGIPVLPAHNLCSQIRRAEQYKNKKCDHGKRSATQSTNLDEVLDLLVGGGLVVLCAHGQTGDRSHHSVVRGAVHDGRSRGRPLGTDGTEEPQVPIGRTRANHDSV